MSAFNVPSFKALTGISTLIPLTVYFLYSVLTGLFGLLSIPGLFPVFPPELLPPFGLSPPGLLGLFGSSVPGLSPSFGLSGIFGVSGFSGISGLIGLSGLSGLLVSSLNDVITAVNFPTLPALS